MESRRKPSRNCTRDLVGVFRHNDEIRPNRRDWAKSEAGTTESDQLSVGFDQSQRSHPRIENALTDWSEKCEELDT